MTEAVRDDAAPAAPGSAADALQVGQVVELDIGAVAHGGHCVARYDGRVLFVRLALPGERVLAELTEVRPGSYCRAVVVQVLRADPERVEPPCPHVAQGCGGCDFQHASAVRQRSLKAAVVAEAFARQAGSTVDVPVEALPEAFPEIPQDGVSRPGFGWRTRVRWAVGDGRVGPRHARSSEIIALSPAQPCLIAAPGLTEAALAAVDKVRPPARAPKQRAGRGRRVGEPEIVAVAPAAGSIVARSTGGTLPTVEELAGGLRFEVAADGFWQAHPAAADLLAGLVWDLSAAAVGDGAVGWDLYGGVGLFAAVLADLVGDTGTVVTVEGDERASTLARQNLTGRPQVQVVQGAVERFVAAADLRDPDVVVLDPPRTGAGPAVCAALAARAPRLIVYVACDPVALARDAKALSDNGYRLTSLRAFDCFPQTQHVECVAAFEPA